MTPDAFLGVIVEPPVQFDIARGASPPMSVDWRHPYTTRVPTEKPDEPLLFNPIFRNRFG
jgi:hypothetical protein